MRRWCLTILCGSCLGSAFGELGFCRFQLPFLSKKSRQASIRGRACPCEGEPASTYPHLPPRMRPYLPLRECMCKGTWKGKSPFLAWNRGFLLKSAKISFGIMRGRPAVCFSKEKGSHLKSLCKTFRRFRNRIEESLFLNHTPARAGSQVGEGRPVGRRA